MGPQSLKAQRAMITPPNTHQQIHRKDRQYLSSSHNQTPMREGGALGDLRKTSHRIGSLGLIP
jgi:hypothetical protein